MSNVNYFARYYPSDSYYPPEYQQVTIINSHIEACRENQLPTTLKEIVDELGRIASWCHEQQPPKVDYAVCYEEIIQRANGIIDSLVATVNRD